MKTIHIKLFPLTLFLFCIHIGLAVNHIKYITPPPTKPVAQNDSASICENSGTTVINVQANDTDADGDPLATSIYSYPKNGTAVVNTNGKSINYTPNNNFSGKDTIIYVVCDNETPENCDTAFVYITINPSPVTTAGAPQTICYGDTISIGGPPNANTTYSWTPNDGLSSYVVSDPKASPADTTEYTLVATNTITGCKSTDSVKITVKPVPSAYITAGDTAWFCTGAVMTLTATNGTSYLWSNGSTTKTITVTSDGDYSVGVTYADGCTDYTGMTAVITVPPPVANAGPDTSVCLGDSVKIGTPASPGKTYSWSPSAGLNYDTLAQPEAGPSVTTKYVLTVTDTIAGCTSTDTVIVKVLPQPIANAGQDKTICKGDSTSIGSPAVAGISYTWSPATGLSSSTAAQPIANPTVTTEYIVTASNGACKNEDTVVVTVVPQPIANAGQDKSICKTDSVTIGTAAVSGVTYSWSPSSGLNYDTAAQPKASPVATTTYVLTASNGTCTNTDTVIVTVLPQPVANAGPDKSICKGDSTTIGSPGVSGVTYSWSPATGLSSSTAAQPNAKPAGTTTYVLTATNGVCSNTDTVTVTVLPSPIANAGPDKSICKTDSVTIGTAAVSGVTYSWSPSSGLNYDTAAQPKASPVATTTYVLTTSNGTCTNKDTVIVTVLPQPIANAGPDKSICEGDSTTIGSPGVSGVTYSWSPATGLSSSTVAQPNAKPAGTTTYVLTATNGVCSNTDTVTVTILPSPIANAGPNKNICKGDSATIGSASVSGVTYTWSPSTGLASSTSSQTNASPLTTTTYVLTATNGSCSKKDSVIVTVAPQPIANVGPNKTVCRFDSISIGASPVSGVTYSWSPATGLSSSTSSEPNASPANNTTYTLTASNGICTNIDSVTVTVNPSPTVTAGPAKSICKGDSTVIGTAATSGITYSWSPAQGLSSSTSSQPNASPSSSTTYTVTASNGTCNKTDTVTVTVLPQPIANAGNDKSICKGDSTTIGSPASTGTSYSWSPATGLSSATYSQPKASPVTTTTYVLTATNGICSNTDTVIVTIATPPTANAGAHKTICLNDSTTIGSTYTAGLKYDWTPASGLNSDTLSEPKASPTTTTIYTLTVTNGGCSASDTVTVTVNQLPAANTGDAQYLCGEGSVTLGSAAVAGDTYLWTPSTGLSSATVSQPTANPGSTITYTLTETDTVTGCSKSNYVQLTFSGDDFYNGISPNGDGINDWWDIPMLDCYQTNTVQIINRWGSEVWSGNNYNNTTVRWDGKDNNGVELPDGTYYYIVKYNNTEKRGWVFIKR